MAEGPLLGFPGERTDAQRDLETRFDAAVDAESLRQWMERLSARPRHVGSPFGKEIAEYLADLRHGQHSAAIGRCSNTSGMGEASTTASFSHPVTPRVSSAWA